MKIERRSGLEKAWPVPVIPGFHGTAGMMTLGARLASMTSVMALLMLVVVLPVEAANRYARANTAWNVNTTWSNTSGGASCACVPLAGDAVFIGEGGTARRVTIPAGFSTPSVASINIGNTTANGVSSLTLSAATATLNVAGTVTVNNPSNNNINVLAVGTGTANLGGVSLGGGTATRQARISISSGIATIAGNIGITNANSLVTFTGAGGRLNLGGNLPSGGTFTRATGTVNFNGSAAQNIGAYTYNTLKVNNAAGATLLGAITTTTLTIGDATASSLFSDGGFQVTSVGTLNLTSGTFKLGAAAATIFPAFATRNITAGTTVEYAAALGQTVSTTPAYSNLTFSGAGTKTTATGTLTILGNWNVGSTTALNTNNTLVNLTGDLTGAGAITQGTGLMTLASDWLNTGAFTAGTGGVTLTGSGRQITGTAGGITFSTLTVNGTYTNNNSTSVTVSTALAGSGGLTNPANAQLHYNGTSAIAPALTATASGNLVDYGALGNQTVKNTSYYHLTLSGSGAKTLPAATLAVNGNFTMTPSATNSATAAGAMTVGGNFTLNTGATFTTGAFNHGIAGNFSNNNTFTGSAGGTITLNGATAQAIGGTSATTFNNLTLSNSNAAVSVNTNINTSAAGTLTVNAGSVLIPGAAVAINNAAPAGTITGSGKVQVTMVAGYSSQYRFTTNALTNITVEYAGTTGAQTISAMTGASAYGNLIMNNASGGSLAAGTTTVGGTLTLTSGTMAVGGNTLALNGPAIAGTAANLTTTSSSNVSFGGSATGIFLPSTVTALNNLTIDNVSGLALNSSPTISGTLTLTNGVLASAGANTLFVTGSNCPGSVVRTNGFVQMAVQLKFPLLGATCTFPIGSDLAYAPIVLTTPIASTGGTLTGSTIGNEHPQIATAGIDATKDANRYWSLWTTGDTIDVGSYDATFGFTSGDLDIGATATNFVLGKYVGGSWSQPTPVTAGATSTGATGIPGPLSSATSFAIGETGEITLPCTGPANMTCVCDNFNRSSLNPSTIFGADWTIGHSSGTFGDPRIVSNALRLTDASTDVSTMAVVPGTFPAAGNTITVEFKHYAYASTTNPGADGIVLTLSDSSVAPVAGAYGGSLGYAQKTGINGFAGGWIGLGIDEYGNFANPTEGRVGGPGFTPEAVTLRGSGSGSGAGATNYPYLVTTGNMGAGAIDDRANANRSRGYLYRMTVDASAYTWNGSTGNKTTLVKVERDTTGTGSSYATLPNLNLPDIFAYSTGQADVPANWKLSLTGGTGSNTNIHDIKNLKICSTFYTPPAGYRIEVSSLSPTTCTTASEGKPIVTVSALDTRGNVVIGYTGTANLNPRLSSPSGSNSGTAAWSKVPSNANGSLVGNQYTFVSGDNGVAKFYLTDTTAEDIYINVSENGGTLTTTLSTPVQYRGTAFSVAIVDSLGTAVVAGRNHLMSITRLSACGTDTTYSGAKSLDGWYSPVTGAHPTGANAPRICAAASGPSCLPGTGACSPTLLSIAQPNLDASRNDLTALTFASGVAYFCLVTTDVGRYSVSLRDDSNIAIPVTGSSSPATVRPFAIAVSNVRQGAINNPASIDPNVGPPFVAGANFQATVSGYLWNSAGDTSAIDGLPDATANLAQVTSAGLAPSYADTVTLTVDTSLATNFAPTAPPAVQGALSGNVTVTSGSGTGTTLNYGEVGSFTLKATPATDYLLSGVDLGNRVAIFAGASTRTSWVGRFRPDHFAIAAGALGSGCGTFTYFGQDGFTTTFTLTAQNAANVTTANYVGDGSTSWAKLPLTAWGLAPATAGSPGFGFAASAWAPSQPAGSSLAASATSPTATNSNAWSAGTTTVTAKHRIVRPSAVAAPTTVTVTTLPVDSDGVTATSAATIGSALLNFGRLWLGNAYGSDKLNLVMPFETQYWNGSVFVKNTSDSCTAIAGSNVALGNKQGGLSAYAGPVTGSTASSGVGSLTLTKPASAAAGSVDLVVNLGSSGSPSNCNSLTGGTSAVLSHLSGKWCGANYDRDPVARATFGIYGGKRGPIYIRESY